MATGIFRKNFPQTDELQKKVDEADYIIGLDLHKKTTAITVVDTKQPGKPVFQRKRLKNIELLEDLVRFPGKKVVVAEAAYGWFPLRRALESLKDITFVLFDSRKTAAWIRSSGVKNDRIDSEVLAYVCLKGGLPALAVYTPSEQCRDRFKLVSIRDQYVRQRTRVKNQLKAIERDYGVNSYTGEIIDLSDEIAFMQNLLTKQLADLNYRIQETEKKIAKISKGDSIITLLRSIPHIGPITAFALRCKMENIERFRDAKHLCAYFGFGVRQKQSGDGSITGKLTRRGNILIRKLLVQGAQGLRSNYPDYLELYFPKLGRREKMRNWKHANKVVIATARKNLTFVYRTWKSGELFDMGTYKRTKRKLLREASSETGSDMLRTISKNLRRLNIKKADASFKIKMADPDQTVGTYAATTV